MRFAGPLPACGDDGRARAALVTGGASGIGAGMAYWRGVVYGAKAAPAVLREHGGGAIVFRASIAPVRDVLVQHGWRRCAGHVSRR